MAFAFAITSKESMGSKFLVHGTYTNTAGGTGGEIETGLTAVSGAWLQPKGAAVLLTQSVINEDYPLYNATGAITAVTSADEVGTWYAFGI